MSHRDTVHQREVKLAPLVRNGERRIALQFPYDTELIAIAKQLGVVLQRSLTLHSLRHSFATHLLEHGTDIRYIQEFFFFNDTATTEIYTHVTPRTLGRITSPLDNL